MTVYAIGDVHGQIAELDRALALIEADGGPGAQVVFLGDYTDRGPDSRAVIDRLINGLAAGRNWTCIGGNHDRMFHRFVGAGILSDVAIASGKTWLHPALGGAATLASYGVAMPDAGTLEAFGFDSARDDDWLALRDAARRAVPRTHLDFLAALPTLHETEAQIFVHAGLRPGVPLADQVEDDLLWIRKGWLGSTADHGRLVVHGHTALEEPLHYGNRLNLDSGAGYGRPITAARIDGRDAVRLTAEGPVPIATGVPRD